MLTAQTLAVALARIRELCGIPEPFRWRCEEHGDVRSPCCHRARAMLQEEKSK